MIMKIALVVSQFNSDITDRLFEGAMSRFTELAIDQKDIVIVKVPGAVEIPLAAKLLAKQKDCQAIICLGAVIRGETDHYRYVCDQVSQGCQQIMLEFEIPVIFGVLTTNTVKQARARTHVGGKHGHKGRDAVDAALEMIALMKRLKLETTD